MSDLPVERDDTVPAETDKAPRLRRTPLLPEAGAAGASLTAVIAVICFLAALSLTGFYSVSKAAQDWTADLRGSITIQVKGSNVEQIAAETADVIAFLEGREGILTAEALSREQAGALLEPWLGRGNLPASLPVPGIIAVKVAPSLRGELDALSDDIGQVAPNAIVDDHGAWNASLAASARVIQIFAFCVFLLIMGAVCTVIIFAARAGLAANREVVDVLHLVGATDKFIAKEVQRRFLILGLRGSVLGVAAAALAVVAAVLVMGGTVANNYFLPSFSTDSGLFIWLLVVPLLTCLVAAWSARTTVLKTLEKRF